MNYLLDVLYILGIGSLLMVGVMSALACMGSVLGVAIAFLMK